MLWMFAFAVLENLGYRQLTLWFRLKAFWKFFRKEHSWGRMEREGFAGRPADGIDSAAGPRPGARGPELDAGTDR